MTSISLTAEDEIYRLCSETEDVSKINLERGPDPEYVFNSRGQKLHVHSYWPAENNLVAIIISLHGMGSHSNRPMQTYMAKKFNENGLAYVCLDFHGHGYSDGVKGLVDSPEYLLDDVSSLLRAMYSDSSSQNSAAKRFRLNRQAGQVPFFIMGHSMGGSTAIFIGHMLSGGSSNISNVFQEWHPIPALFRGCLLLCPAIDIKMPPAFIVAALDYLVVPFFPNYSVPELFVARKSSQNLIWKNKTFQDYVTRDGYPANPKGLSYGDPVRFQTASTLVKLAGRLKVIISEIRFPFIVFHDPTEQIVLVQGSERLVEKSQTPPVRKAIVMVEGGLHDLLSNNFTFITDKSIEWIKSQMSMAQVCFDAHTPCGLKCDTLVKRKTEDYTIACFLLVGGIFTFTALIRLRIIELLY